MNNQNELYVDVILPLDQPPLTYRVGEQICTTIERGRCVMAQVGSKFYTAIVLKVHTERPSFKTIRTIEEYVKNAPRFSDAQLRFWEWLAEYYMCRIGSVMRVGLPSSLKPDGFSADEFVSDTYAPPKITYIALHPSIDSEQRLNEEFDKLKRAKRQQEALSQIIEQLGKATLFSGELVRAEVDASLDVLRAMEKKEVITLVERELKQGELPPLSRKLPILTDHQQEAYDKINEQFLERDVVLLHGVTGSGKTEIYIKLIDQTLQAGRDVLYLLPEIAMTTQLVERVRRYFGKRLTTYHSRYSERNRVESYLKINRSKGGQLLMGARSALFLPSDRLGLVVIDEEHDQSYKSDSVPMYNARDSAIMLARMVGAKTVLGSATPSLESYANAMDGGKYGYVQLTERYGGVGLPRMIISDTLTAVKRGERYVHFNKALVDRVKQAVESEEQVMLFQNRRGFSPYVECTECGWVPFCPNCNVALTLHKRERQLKCHYCGYNTTQPKGCERCGSESIEPQGFGTQKVEEELALLLPEVRISRLDSDSSRSVSTLLAIVGDFEARRSDVLVGTQMITKGFDFDGVSLVGILNADNLLTYPDFRAFERAFQLISQVAGRAGRRDKQGEVVVQTSQPTHPIIQQAASYDYEGMAQAQLSERRMFSYPPYYRIITITLSHRDLALLWSGANHLGAVLRPIFGRRLLGPQPPPVDKVKREHILIFTLKVERERSYRKAKELLSESIKDLHSERDYRNVKVICNVDP